MEDRSGLGNVVAGGTMLDPSVLTIGFARRFATYKRADLIFSDLERLKKLLNDPWRSLQIIFAGKAHPEDDPGKIILQRIFKLSWPDLGEGHRKAWVKRKKQKKAKKCYLSKKKLYLQKKHKG